LKTKKESSEKLPSALCISYLYNRFIIYVIRDFGTFSEISKRRMIMNIYVGNLSYEATDVTIREAFESFGQVTSARVIKDKYNGQSRGFGFVEMPAQSQAQTAIKSLNGKELLGKQMSVNEARPRADQGRTRGGRMDYSGRGYRY
jgi:RNA recognition motif-containing protein